MKQPGRPDFALALAVSVVMLGIGFFFGYEFARKPFAQSVEFWARGESLGHLRTKTEEAKRLMAQAYYNPQKAFEELDDYPWAPPQVMTPFVGHAPRPGTMFRATVNNMQFRTQKELAMPKPEGILRIFLIGGSTAFGVGAPSQETTIAGYLEKYLKDAAENREIEVATFADTGWTTTHERIAVVNRLLDLEPDMAISFSGCNDVHWGAEGRNSLWIRTLTDEYFRDMLNRTFEFAGEEPMSDVIEVTPTYVEPELVAERALRNADIITHCLSNKGAKYLFVLQPVMPVTRKGLSDGEYNRIHKHADYFRACYPVLAQELKNAAEKSDMHFLDLTGLFDELGAETRIFLDNYHFGDRGNDMIAKAIARSVLPLINTDN
jgi:lysophospholipase L1-like esterase